MTGYQGERTWQEAIDLVLSEAGGALHYSKIAELIQERGLRSRFGATPANTVNMTISTSIRDGHDHYVRVATGEYALAETLLRAPSDQAEDVVTENDRSNVIRAFGMFWRRDEVVWNTRPAVLGRVNEKSDTVDFSGQIGVYVLHDRERPIYVGRATRESLGSRLLEHTKDRHEGRWDRFSWFGLKDVDEGGALSEAVTQYTLDAVVEAFEAILIECVEPVQNRRRGDGFNAVEFLQAPSEHKRKRRLELFQEIAGIR